MARMASEKQTMVVEDGGIMGEYDKSREKRFNRTATKLSAKANPAHGEFLSSESELMHVQEEEDKDQKKNGRDRKEEDEEEDYKENVDKMSTSTKKKQTDSGSRKKDEVDHVINTDEIPDRTLNAFLDQISLELEDLPWEVECTKSFVKTMSGKMNSTIKNKILMTISKLANGDWHQSISKELHSPYKPKNVWLYEAKIGRGCRLIWQKAIAFSSKLSVTTVDAKGGTHSNKDTSGDVIYSEVIRIWDYVTNHDDIYKYVVNICSALKNEKQEDMKRSAKHPSTLEKTLPAYFGHDLTEIVAMHPPVKVAKEEFQIVKFYAFSSDMFEHIRKQSTLDVDFPFRVTDLEHSIINLESHAPILLIGRSGTGKTTCCLYRLWHQFIGHLSMHCEEQELTTLAVEGDVENVYKDNSKGDCDQGSGTNKKVTNSCIDTSAKPEEDQQHMDDSVLFHNRLHQIFVTRNKLLCIEAKRNFNEMKHGSSIAQKFGLCDDNSLPWRFEDIRDSQYPLFLTLEQLLIMMDASIGPSFFYDRESNGSLKGSKRKLFEEDLSISGITERMREGIFTIHSDSLKSRQTCQQPTEVTYEIFSNVVWPKIATGCKYQPLLVWMEFISIIKGSYEALLQPKGYLSRAMYLIVGKKRAPNFDGNRDEIYNLFQKYQQFSTKKNLFDECDLIHSIQSRLQPEHTEAWAIHQLFVDEIQDFTQAELCLLIKICQDPNQMFLTGDTAQTVMHGIEFRFCDLKSLFYNIRESMKTDSHPEKYLVEVPEKIHQLTHSYRSHDGILSLASSVLDIMAHLFPDSFDRLQTDKSLIEGGPLPVLFESSNFSELVRHISDKKDQSDDSSDIELGVHQAILVINETARQHLPRQLQQNITLTIYESKGLEFNNIFLFNFFKFSQASKEWRAVTSLLTELTANDTGVKKSRTGMYQLDEGMLRGKGRPRALEFDQKSHKVLNSELKLLYTAVTRARVNVWIFDEDLENRRPMFEYFQAHNLVTVKSKHSTSNFTKDQSETNEWLARGEDFMRTGVYREAAKCFDKGGDKSLAALANAYNSEEIARNLRDQKSRNTKLLQTAELYRKCDSPHDARAIPCYEEGGDFRAAATYCEEIKKFEQAAVIYKTRLNQPVESSNCYEKAHCFDDAVKILCESGNYEIAIDVVSRYTHQIKDMESKNEQIPLQMKKQPPLKTYTMQQLRIKCVEGYDRMYQCDRNDVNINKMKDHLRYLSFDEHCNVLTRLRHIDLAVELMLTKGKHEEASRLCLSNGKSEEALAIARKSGNNELIAQYLFSDIQFKICNDQIPDKSQMSDQVQELDMLSQITRNSKLQGQAYLLKAEIQIGGKAKELETALDEALGTFKRCDPPCKAGQIDCLSLMLNNLTESNIASAVEEMHTLFDVVEVLDKTNHSPDDSRAVQSVYNYFGFEQKSNGLALTTNNHHRLAPEMIRSCKTKNESEVKNAIINFLKEGAHKWYTKIQAYLDKWIENIQPCTGHGYLPIERMKKLLNIDLLQVELNGYLAETSLDLGIPELRAQQPIQPSLEPCYAFFRHLLPRTFITCCSTEKWCTLADPLRKIKESVKRRLITGLKDEYKHMTRTERKRSTVLFMKHHFFVKYLELDFNVRAEMDKFGEDLYNAHLRIVDKAKAHGIIRFLGGIVGAKTVESLAVRFVEAYDNIADRMDPMGALVKFTVFLKLLRGHERLVLPDCNYLIMWMEYFLVVASYLAAKADHTMNFNLPTSYTNVTHYIDSSFATTEKTTLEVINRTMKKHLKVNSIQDRIEAMASFLCGDGCKTGLMTEVFTSENVDVEVSERVLMLSLTLLCNMRQMLYTTSEPLLLRQLRSITLPQHPPPRLAQAVDTLKTATGPLDIGNTFRRLLFERGEELRSYSLCWGNVDFKPLTILNGILPSTFYEKATRTLLEPPKKDTSEERGDTEHDGATGTLPPTLDKDTSGTRGDTEHDGATGTLPPTLDKDTSGTRGDTEHDGATGTLPPTLVKDTSGTRGDTEHDGATGTLPPTLEKDTSAERANTEHKGMTRTLLQTPEIHMSGENVENDTPI